MNDLEIQEKVESLAGKGTKVLDCEKSTSFQQEEVLLVNGFPVKLEGEQGARIKAALLSGQVPPGDLLNEILMRAGILKNPVELEATVNVKTTTKTTEVMTLRDKNGILLDERMKEIEEDNQFQSTSKEIWKKDLEGQTGHLQSLRKRLDNLGSNLAKISFNSSSENTSRNCSTNGSSLDLGSSSSPRHSPAPSGNNTSSVNGINGINGVNTANGACGGHNISIVSVNGTGQHSSHSPQSSSSGISDVSSRSESSASSLSSRFSPSIFGTVAASSPSPDFTYTNNQRKTLPQTQLTGNGPPSSVVTNGSHSIESSEMNPIAEEETRQTPPTKTPCDWDNALVYQDTNLVSGTLDALISLLVIPDERATRKSQKVFAELEMVPTQSYYPDRAYVFAFLLSSRLYIRPHELLGRVFRLAMATPGHSPKYQSLKEVKTVAHIVQLLGEWTQLFPYDFRDERMMAHVRTITQKCVSVDPSIRKEVSQLLSSLLSKLTALERYEDFLHRINIEAALSEPSASCSVLTMCPSPSMLAQQLTHIELERLSKIGPEEFVQAFEKDNAAVETKYKDMKKTRNLESYVQWFNRLSYYVATEVCKLQKKKSRIRVKEYFVESARECFNIGNFNSLMAIIAGLNMSPVARLKKTWAKVNTAQLSILEHQMDPTSNFTSYRSTLKAAVWRSAGAVDERQRIVIPFFSLLVKDLYFLNEGCASQLANGHINFDKFWQLAKQVTEVVAWQQISCPFPKVQAVLNALQTAPIFGENDLYLSSFDCEPADNAQEKERLKYLRNDKSTPTSTKAEKKTDKSHK